MSLRTPLRAAALLALLPLTLAHPARGDGGSEALRLKAADERGLTLELTLRGYQISPGPPGLPGQEGRSILSAPGLEAHAPPGRPVLPSVTTLIALPPGARAIVAGVDGDPEETRDGVRLTLGSRHTFEGNPLRDAKEVGLVPTLEPAEPIQDGPWPLESVELGTPFTLRGQRLVAVTVRPFRYDEAGSRLWVRRRLAVRIAFAGGTAGRSALPGGATGAALDDPHWDPVFRGTVLNFEQGRHWRSGATGVVRRSTTGLEIAPGRRGATPARATAFDESDPEVRVQIDSTGVYALTYDQLAAKGYPAGVPVGQVSVHRHEYVADADPSYDTVELPIEIDEASPANGTFDTGDRIVLYVQSWAERTNATLPQRTWGDGDVVFVTRLNTIGRRIGSRLGWQGLTGQTPLASYPWSQRWEKNLWYLGSPGTAPAESTYDQFHWTTFTAYYARYDTILFDANDIDPAHNIDFTMAWQGRSGGQSFYVWGQVRNADYSYYMVGDSATIGIGSGKQDVIATATLPGDAMSEGGNNSVISWARRGSSPPDPSNNTFASVGLNWFAATYWRGYHAIKNQLDCNSGDAAGPFEVLATGYSDSSALRAYDVTDPADPRRLTNVLRERPGPNNYALRFQDDATAGRRRYLVFSQARSVPASRITAVTRSRLTSLSGDYLVLAPEAWRPALQPLMDLRDSQGHHSLFCPVEAIYDEFNGGRRSANAIKSFIRYALNTWRAQFVVLGGDGSADPQNFLGDSGPDIVPIYKMPGPVGVPIDGRELVPSDGWYVWCLNGCDPSDPILPELYIGRLPAKTSQQMADLVGKLVSYENLSGDQTWRTRLLLMSDDQYSGITTFGGGGGGTGYCYRFYEQTFEQLNRTIRSKIVDEAGLRRLDVELFDLSYWLRNEPVDANNCRPNVLDTQSRTRTPDGPWGGMLDRLNAGRMWWNYQGHANQYLLAHENLYRNVGADDDKEYLTNVGRPFLFSAFSCHANAFAEVSEDRPDLGPTLGEDLVMLKDKGAIGSYASVGYEIIPDLGGTTHINVSLADAMFLNPPHDDLLGNGDLGARVLFGESIAQALLHYIPSVQGYSSEAGLLYTYTLLGDPATRLSIGQPEALVTANGDTVISDRPISLAPPRDTLKLEADLVSTVEIRTIQLLEGVAGGTRVIPDSTYTLNPAFPDTAATGHGGRRYHLSYVTPIRPGTVRYTLRTTDRYGLGNDFDVVFPFFTQLRVSDNPLAKNDAVTPTADLSLQVTLPTPIADPDTEFVLTVDHLPQAFVATSSDTTRRLWVLRWTHAPYPVAAHVVTISVLDSLNADHPFQVLDQAASGEHLLRDVVAFPNPFDIGSAFSYYLLSDGPADVMLRVFTVTGKLIYQRVERGLPPGYHQWPWNGLDAESEEIANGVYLYKMIATTASRTDTYLGRLVRLRKPRHGETTTP